MNQDELIAKLTPAIGLRRQLDPRAHPKSEDCADPVVTIRPLRPAERAFSDATLDTILVERETDPHHDQPCGIVASSSYALRLTWFPGATPTTIRLLAEGISATTSKPTAYVQIFHGTAEHITTAAAIAKAVSAWTDDDLAT